jgi:hypothetical protein
MQITNKKILRMKNQRQPASGLANKKRKVPKLLVSGQAGRKKKLRKKILPCQVCGLARIKKRRAKRPLLY